MGNFINIFFESHYENDDISINCDGTMVYKKSISTDHTINLAGYHLQKSSCNELDIGIGNEKYNLSRNIIGKYKYLYIKKEKNIVFTLSHAPRTYY
ncbi:hypothetical protein CHRYSEOSP005_29430 [Chryseobacterium sp. Alg-005]|uniref:hypothetical protein n=1 Tax=Chryseobacterium sp. Alg-005 TaxID=3159516 RepID=UPI0035558EC9